MNTKNKALTAKWITSDIKPKENKDVIAVLKCGTIFMARHNINGWGLYFLDNGLQFDPAIGKNVTHWIPLTALPKNPNR